MIDFNDFLRDLVINFVAGFIFVYLLYYRRHGDRDTAVMLGLFNAFLFTIVISVTLTNIDIAAGFALFAVLSIVTLRSVNLEKIEVGYLFGGIALALINGLSLPDYAFLALGNAVILGAAFIIDSPLIFRPTLRVDVALEGITVPMLANTVALRTQVEEKYGMQVRKLSIKKYDADTQALRLIALIESNAR